MCRAGAFLLRLACGTRRMSGLRARSGRGDRMETVAEGALTRVHLPKSQRPEAASLLGVARRSAV